MVTRRDFQELGKTLLHGRGFRTNGGSMVSSLVIIGLFFFSASSLVYGSRFLSEFLTILFSKSSLV